MPWCGSIRSAHDDRSLRCATQLTDPLAWLRSIGDHPEKSERCRNIEEPLVGAAETNNDSAKVDGCSNKQEWPAQQRNGDEILVCHGKESTPCGAPDRIRTCDLLLRRETL